jgi:hypothetical protein
MSAPHLASGLLLGLTFGTMVTLTAAQPAGAQDIRPDSQSVVGPERVQEPGSTECSGEKCRNPERRRSVPPPEKPCRGHNPELGPPCASPQR